MADKFWTATGSATSLATTTNWNGSALPIAGDNVRFPAGTAGVNAGLTTLSTATLGGSLGYLIFEPGYEGVVGVRTVAQANPTYMDVTPSRFEFAGTGQAFINLQAANIAALVNRTATPVTGERGLYLKGTGPITVLTVNGGSVGVAAFMGEVSTVTTARVNEGGSLWLGAGVTGTTVQVHGGFDNRIRCALTTLTQYAGEVTTEETGAITTVNLYGGRLIPGSTGTITTLNGFEGDINFMEHDSARTVTTLNMYYATATFNVEAVTLTNGITLQRSARASFSRL